MPFLWCQMPFHVNSILDLQYLHFLKGKTKCQQVFINNGFTNSSFRKRKQFELFCIEICVAKLLISFVFSKKNPRFLQRLVAILREYRRLRLAYSIQSTHVYTSKPSRDIPVWQMIRMDMKISRIVLTEKVNYLECEKGLRKRTIS